MTADDRTSLAQKIRAVSYHRHEDIERRFGKANASAGIRYVKHHVPAGLKAA